jgi:hypothetical protein
MKHPVLAHVSEHTWLWIGAFAAAGAILAALRISTPAAIAIMIVGMLIMIRSQGTDVLSIVTSSPADDTEPGQADDRDASPGTAALSHETKAA